MRRWGFEIARCTVACVMKDIGVEGVIRGKKPKTMMPDKTLPCPQDRVDHKFCASAPNVLRVSDVTYVATWQGFVHVTFVIDVFARRILGWRVSRTATAGNDRVSIGTVIAADIRKCSCGISWRRNTQRICFQRYSCTVAKLRGPGRAVFTPDR
ncbi:hypothetical protein Jann_3011 [Jannaschia sp. CCS1]|nr:hypothetical protein Jann_3011 [Jannaschia sp. CCS1]